MDRPALLQLARLYGILPEYYDVAGNLRQATPDAMLSALRSLGAPVHSLDDVPAALSLRAAELHRRRIEPVIVGWVNDELQTDIRIPDGGPDRVSCILRAEDGQVTEWTITLDELPAVDNSALDGERVVVRRISLPVDCPPGYHKLQLDWGDRATTSTVIVAPRVAWQGMSHRAWGAFLPLYALHDEQSLGIGSYGDLRKLSAWLGGLGGELAGTLPLLSSFLGEPFDPSPYSPVSRRFWNEIFIDIETAPEFARSAAGWDLLQSDEARRTLDELKRDDLVDYRRAASLKRRLLAELSRELLRKPSVRLDAFHDWVDSRPLVTEYARFMATADRERRSWLHWPERQRSGRLSEEDYDQANAHYHLYVQWLAEEQINAIAHQSVAARLYLDLPLGVHRDGFDVWREREQFAIDVRVGAPPDPLSWEGQDWAFPPLHPERVREDGYDYFRQCIRHHLQYAGALRIDHVMGLHRLFWIPEGIEARDGLYVQYRPEEFYAVLTLESHRSRALLIGEDLGTVPQAVREAMEAHGLRRMYVIPFEIGGDHEDALRTPGEGVLATVNTHDMPPFATAWSNLDEHVRWRIIGFLRERGWLEELARDPGSVYRALVQFLGDGPGGIVLLNLEDLWLETESQNVPGTIDEHPNWRRKARHDLQTITTSPEIASLLGELNFHRSSGR